MKFKISSAKKTRAYSTLSDQVQKMCKSLNLHVLTNLFYSNLKSCLLSRYDNFAMYYH